MSLKANKELAARLGLTEDQLKKALEEEERYPLPWELLANRNAFFGYGEKGFNQLDVRARDLAQVRDLNDLQGSAREIWRPLLPSSYRVSSTGEQVYIAFAANRPDVLALEGYTLAKAIDRLGSQWLAELALRWRYADDPRSQR